ncbi:MAG: F0F1 ATP synthase subunit delta [Opitutales bacterium]|nr:F0F1 ATP synthase subunit delta [Opitutales bacterium]
MAKKDKNLQKVTAKLAELSRGANGQIDAARVKAVLAELPKAFPPAQLRPILEAFYAVIARELRFSEARIEYAGTLDAGTAKAIAAHFSVLYNRPIAPVATENTALLGGLRVQVGDDVYDASLAGTLARLRASLASA